MLNQVIILPFFLQNDDNPGFSLEEFEEASLPEATTADMITSYNRVNVKFGIDNVMDTDPRNPLERFLKTALTHKSYSNKCIVGYGDFLKFVYQGLLHFKQEPSTKLRKGKNFLRLEVNLNNLTFISLDYHLPKSFESQLYCHDPEGSVYFPMSLNYSKFYNVSSLPDFDYFTGLNDTAEDIAKKSDYYKKLDVLKEWNFHKAMQAHLSFTVTALMEICLAYCEMALDWQWHLIHDLKLENIEAINPLTASTISQFFYAVLTNYTLSLKDNIYSFSNGEKGKFSGNSSATEFRFQCYLKFSKPNNELIASFLTPSGAIQFGKESPDVLDLTEGIYYLLHGCW